MSMEALERELVGLAFCWRLDRRDGVSMGLTSHDRDLMVDGLIYRASPGMLPSAVSVGAGLDVDSMDVKGALTSDAISEADLKRSEEHTSELQSLMRISYAVFCLKNKHKSL